ncbi:hypothetical protein BVX93_00820 [bacterium B13(2017)]|nr:hypothetical protein BVX93_00820 [bacterium B13(2017)]
MHKKIKCLYTVNNSKCFSKEGILVDFWLDFPSHLLSQDFELQIIQPYYDEVEKLNISLEKLDREITLTLGERQCKLEFLKGILHNKIPIIFIKCNIFDHNLSNFDDIVMEDFDLIYQISFFNHAVLEYIKLNYFIPDVIHCNGFETGLIPVLIKKLYYNISIFNKIFTIIFIKDFSEQGNFDPSYFGITGLPWTCYNLYEMEFWGNFSLLKAGIIFSDGVLFWSNKKNMKYYIEEHSFGFKGILENRKKTFWTFPVGVDYSKLKCNYSLRNYEKNKIINKKKLIDKLNLKIKPSLPLIALVGSLELYTHDEKFDSFIDILYDLDVGFIICGSVNKKIITHSRNYSKAYRDKFGFITSLDNKHLSNILGSCDMLLITKLQEKFPLLHLYSLGYGTIPIVSNLYAITEGIERYNYSTMIGNGFCFETGNISALLGKIITATNIMYHEKHSTFIIKNAMKTNFNINDSVRKYTQIIKTIINRKSVK